MNMRRFGILPITNSARGNAVVEFALVLPILLLVLFGITELGRMVMTKNVLATASREGARYAAVHSESDSTDARARVIEVLAAARIDASAINISYDVAGHSVSVEVITNFEILSRSVLPDVLRGTIELRGETVFRYE